MVSHLIHFYTSLVTLLVKPWTTDRANYVVYHLSPTHGELPLGRILLDPEWYEKQTDKRLEFIIIGNQSLDLWAPRRYQVHTLCIERIDGIAYRVNKKSRPIAVEDWMATKPPWVPITL